MSDTRQEELDSFRHTVQRFITTEIKPDFAQWEKNGLFPRNLWNVMGAHGLLAVDIPEAYGGSGADFEYSMVIAEELQRANCGGIAGGTIVHSDIVAHYVLNHGSDEQKQRLLPGMVSGELVGAVAMTEPGAGSDLQGIRTSAKRDGENFVINGSKIFITNGQHCDFVIVVARTNTKVSGAKGTSLFIVDKEASGFSRGRNLDKIGLHSSDTSELFFDDVYVPDTCMLGALDQGFVVLMSELQRERLSLAIGAVAAAEGVLATTIDYVKERHAFGKPLSALQNTKFKLAETATDIRIHRAFVDECLRDYLQNKLDVATVSMAKLSCSEMQSRVADTCLQLHGGYGYMSEYGVSRAYVDARVQQIYGGTSEIMKELISRNILS